MTGRFADRIVLVTGAGSGIGRGIALAFATEGAVVALAGRRADALQQTQALIEAAGGRAWARPTDLTDAGEAQRLVDDVVNHCGGMHVAVNNAAVFVAGGVLDLDDDAWTALLASNVVAVASAMRHEVRYMAAHGGGAIVNVSANLGAHVRRAGLTAYATSKAAVSALTRGAALDHIGDGVRINAVSPGPVDAPMSSRGGSIAERDERVARTNPSGRVASLDEIASAVLWLASDTAAYTVGHDLVVDGGASA